MGILVINSFFEVVGYSVTNSVPKLASIVLNVLNWLNSSVLILFNYFSSCSQELLKFASKAGFP